MQGIGFNMLSKEEILKRINENPAIKWEYKTYDYAVSQLCPEDAGLQIMCECLDGTGSACRRCWELSNK